MYKKKKEKEVSSFLPFTDDFIFSLVMRDKEICSGLLNMILPEEDFCEIKLRPQNHPLFSEETLETEDFDPEKLAVEIQKSLKFDKEQHGVRFDALAKGLMQWAEIEMQTYKGEHLGKRSRSYQANMDLDQLEEGADYKKLKRTYVIFICTYDYFGMDEPVYYFQSFDKKLGLPFDDEAYKLILNTACSEEKVPEHLKAFYAYINDPQRNEGSEFVKALDDRVRKFNTPEWRHRQMTLQEIMDRKEKEGYAAGLEEGQELGQERLNTLYLKLKESGRMDDLIRAMEDEAFRRKMFEELK